MRVHWAAERSEHSRIHISAQPQLQEVKHVSQPGPNSTFHPLGPSDGFRYEQVTQVHLIRSSTWAEILRHRAYPSSRSCNCAGVRPGMETDICYCDTNQSERRLAIEVSTEENHREMKTEILNFTYRRQWGRDLWVPTKISTPSSISLRNRNVILYSSVPKRKFTVPILPCTRGDHVTNSVQWYICRSSQTGLPEKFLSKGSPSNQ